MAQTARPSLSGGTIPEFGQGNRQENLDERQRVRTKGWQVVNVQDNINASKVSYNLLTKNRYAQTVINVYQAGQRDEMHCHPGSEHIFMVFQGELHIRGINEGEDITLKPGELVHINQSYPYQLCNDTDGVTVLYQVATRPPRPSKIGTYILPREFQPAD
jgi:mannose-6-phosphate isomerase-like protein (cupin superfamily)